MADSKRKAPKLRFPGFNDDWEQRKLGEMGNTFTGLSGKTKEDFGHGNAKFVTYMNVFGNAISDSNLVENVEIDNKQIQVEYGDVFFTTSSETPEEVGMSSVWMENIENVYLNSFCFGWRPKEKLDPYYLAFMLRSPAIRMQFMLLAQGISRYNISKKKVMEMLVPVPEFKEQKTIGKFFKQLDDLITLHQRKLSDVQKLKSGLLQKMFPKNGKKVPEIRFPEFSDDWEQRKLGEVTTRVRGNDERMNLPTLTMSAGSGWLDQKDRFSGDISGKEKKNYTLLSKGELSYNHGNSKLAKYGVVFVLRNYDEALVPKVYHSFKTNEKAFGDFIEYMFATKLPDRELGKLVSSGARMDGLLNINYDDFININITIPSISEQKQISSLFRQLDNLITLHQRKLEHLQQQKKALLQQMFI